MRSRCWPHVIALAVLGLALSALPADHINATPSMADAAAELKAVTAEQVKAFYARFYGAQSASIAVVGDVDAAEVEKVVSSSLGSWSSKEKY